MGFQGQGRALRGENRPQLYRGADFELLSKRILWINGQSDDVDEIRELSFTSKD
jgi:hypothetical protein